MKHLTDILIEKGYVPYRYSCIFPDQNTSAKTQNNLMTMQLIIFYQMKIV